MPGPGLHQHPRWGLNELLAPILEMLESLEKSDMLGDDAEYLLGNEFVVKDYGCGLIIDFKN